MAKADYYETLGVARGADAATLKSAYRKLAKQYHPDRNQGDASAEQKFKQVSEAYDILKDPQSRAAYDRFGHAAFENGAGNRGAGGRDGAGRQHNQQSGFNANFGGGDINDIFEEFFGGGRGGGGRNRGRNRGRQNTRGRDLQTEIEISLADAYTDTTRNITINAAVPCKACNASGANEGAAPEQCSGCGGAGAVRSQRGFMVMEQICPQCQGAGEIITDPCRECGGQGRKPEAREMTIKIPAGVDNGTRIRLGGEGEAGLRSGATGSAAGGGQAGDFFVSIRISAHPFLEREGANLFCQMPVPFTLAAAGGQVDVPLLDGKRVKLTIPAGAQSGHQLRLRGKGMPVLQRSQYGDLYVRITTETAVNLTAAQKKLLKQLEDSLEDDNYPASTEFVARTGKKANKK